MEKNRFLMLVTIHILFIKNDEILLSLRKNISSDGLYGLVAGHLDGGESVMQAIIREAKEEVGVEINADDIKISTICHSYKSENKKEFIQFYIICKKWSGEIINKEPEKCSEVKFFPLSNLPENIVPYVRDAIFKTLNNVQHYEYGWQPEHE